MLTSQDIFAHEGEAVGTILVHSGHAESALSMFLEGRQRSVNEIDDRGGPRVGIMAVAAKIDTATKTECVPFHYLCWKS